MRKIWIFLVLLWLPLATFAGVEFFGLLPNPLGDDTLGEYIEIRNTGCMSIDIGGYHLYDAANKTYVIPNSTIIFSHENIRFLYATTKITLNNSGSESITLTDRSGSIIDTESYSGIQKDNVVIYLTTTDEHCTSSTESENNNSTGATNTGTADTGTGASGNSVGQSTETTNTGTTSTGTISTGETTEQNPQNPLEQGGSGTMNTGTMSTGSFVPQDDGLIGTGTTSTGTTSTGTTNTGTTNTGTTNTGTTNTGTTNTGTTDSEATNTGVLDNTGMTNIGTADTGTGASEASRPVQSEAWEGQSIETTNTGTTSTGITVTVSIQNTNTGILFPDIFPTRQEPTNAIFSGGIWDCGTHQPCRVNVTFDPIFTGGLIAKNYICEVITATGTFATCNPNTLYFSTDSSFSLRLTSKSVPSQSRTVSWGVSFTVVQHNSSTGGNIGTGTVGSGSGASETSGGQGSGITSTGTTDSDTTNSGILQQSYTGVTFPQIIPTFQNHTNTTHSGDTLTCVTSPCRVNFTLDPIFTGSFAYKNYTCEIHYGTGVYTSCNPPQLYPIGTDSIEIILTHRASGQKETKTLEIVQAIPVPVIANDRIAPIPGVPDTNPPIAILEFDGKLQSYYEQIDTYEFNCYTLTCSINLTADRSYDSEGGAVRFLWYYGPNDIKITRDPGGRKYGLGDHEIWLRVMDIAGNMSEIRYRIHVLGPRDKEEQVKTKKIKDPSLTKKKISGAADTSGGQKKKKKKKPKKMDFFDPPTITMQKSKFTETNNGYLCRTKTKTCSLNLTLSGAEKGILYTWTYDDGEVISSKNPRSKKLSLGSHKITVAASYSGSTDILWIQTISARVDKITKPKKAKKIKAKKPPKTERLKKRVQSLILPPASEQPPIENDILYTTMALISGIIPVALLRRFLINKI